MIAASQHYDDTTNSLRHELFQAAHYLNKTERFAMLEAACSYIYRTAIEHHSINLLPRCFRLAISFAHLNQRVHPLCAVLIRTIFDDLGLEPDFILVKEMLGDVGLQMVEVLDTVQSDIHDNQVTLCIQQIETVYQHITNHARQALLQTAKYLSTEDIALLNQACDFGIQAHHGQFRNSGVPYITHPIAVATQLAVWRVDIQGLCAGVLHDVLEDTGTTKAQLVDAFGMTIADMVDGLSKLEKLEYSNQEEQQAENFRKLILAMTKDIRVIIVKLSDRLHNMRTLDAKKPESRRRIARETLEIYAQLANRIGLNQVYRELQDLSFMHLYPNRYRVLARALNQSKRKNHDVVGTVLKAFSQRLVGANIEAQIRGREKNLFSIYQKMQQKNLRFAEVMDIYGFRVVVNSIPACYTALGVLHSLYKPKPGKIKDYIAIPKANGYQSLHTTLVGPRALPIEVQIRTQEMDAIAEGGIASYWMYQSGEQGSFSQAQMRTHQWLQTILDLQDQSANALEFLENVKVDLFPDEVYIFTPKGKIVVLPKGATPIDFAYAVHTDIGNHTVAVRINHNMMPLRTKLHTGDTVEIITSERARPNPAWLNFAISSRARSAIRHQIKHMDRSDAIALGENLLQKALSSLLPENVLLSESLKEKYLSDLATKKTSFEEVLYDVGMGRLQPVSVAMHIAELAGEHFGDVVTLSPIKISGSDMGRIHLATCCNPIPGDAVKALLVKDQGMIIHRDNCEHVLKADPDFQLDADWDAVNSSCYRVQILVTAQDAHALLLSLAQAISSQNANIESVDTPSKKQDGVEGFIEFRFTLQVNHLVQLSQIIHALYAIPEVRRVVRL